jgi:hypothetical protein
MTRRHAFGVGTSLGKAGRAGVQCMPCGLGGSVAPTGQTLRGTAAAGGVGVAVGAGGMRVDAMARRVWKPAVDVASIYGAVV